MIMTTDEQYAYDCVMSSHIARTVAEDIAKSHKIGLDMATQHVWNWSDKEVQDDYQRIMSEHSLAAFRTMSNSPCQENC